MLALPAGKALNVGAWARDPLWRKAQAVPALDIPFATTKSLVDRISGQNLITFGRAGGTATYVDATGTSVTAAANEPCFTHDPVTLRSLGLRMEEPRTNYIRNNTMVGAAAGVPGTLPANWNINAIAAGLSRAVVGTGVENGISYIDLRLNGTTSDTNAFQLSFEGSTTTAAVNGQAWTNSFYCKVVAGTLANITTAVNAVNMFSATPANLGAIDLNFTPASSATPFGLARIANPVTLNQASTASVQPRIRLTIPSGVAVDVTLRIGLPQLEQGGSATSPIPTTGAQATRNAEVATITGAALSSWYRQDEGTLLIQWMMAAFPNTSGARVFEFNSPSGTDIIWGRVQGGTNRVYDVTAGGVSQASLAPGAYTAGQSYRSAIAYKANDFAFSENGGIATDVAGSVPLSIDRLGIGCGTGGGSQGNLTIFRLTFFPQRLPNAKLQAITA